MIEFVAAILAVSLALYCIFGGADFGGGILEVFKGRHYREEQVKLITQAMGPVWESNHMWLIIAVVITFNGFPSAFATFSIIYHVPLTIMLFGVILRGCAFTFRHYDAVYDRSQKVYSLVFAASSAMTPFMMGTIAGSCLLGEIHPLESGYWNTYLAPWCNPFCFSVGLFACSIFTFVAAVFLIEEAEDNTPLATLFRRRALAANLASIGTGLLVFATAWYRGFDLIGTSLAHPAALAAMVTATALLWPLWRGLSSHRKATRLLAALQVLLILTGYLVMMFPDYIKGAEAAGFGRIDIYSTASGEATLFYLAWALVAGLIIVIPPLGYLLYIFKMKTAR